ncbi:hypothetical protein M5689_009971 [Euphorbia peplus]|nr:hypothetical protein M5689_009971 [Euphorbia peplus]
MSDKPNRHRRRPSQSVFTEDFSAPLSDDVVNGGVESGTAPSAQLRQQVRNPLPPTVADAAAEENGGKGHEKKAKGVGN